MTVTYLKTGKPAEERAEDDTKTRAVVESTLDDIEARGDTAVRELSEKFDKYSPESFRLSQEEIDDLMAQLTPRELEDIRFAQERRVWNSTSIRSCDSFRRTRFLIPRSDGATHSLEWKDALSD